MASRRYESTGASNSGLPFHCPTCDGTGKVPKFMPPDLQHKCEDCNGTGFKSYFVSPEVDRVISEPTIALPQKCIVCNGTGKIINSAPFSEQNKCAACNGTGYQRSVEPPPKLCPSCGRTGQTTIAQPPSRVKCPVCNGRQWHYPIVASPSEVSVVTPCSHCNGTGWIEIPQPPIQIRCLTCGGNRRINNPQDSGSGSLKPSIDGNGAPGCFSLAILLGILGMVIAAF